MQQLTTKLSIRELSKSEAETPELLPPELRASQLPYLVPDWCWVVEHIDGGPIALIVTAHVHGILFIWRILAIAKARTIARNWFLAALPRILENAKLRGCVGYGAFLHDEVPAEAKLARIMSRSGAALEPWIGSIAVNTLYPEK